ncbi:hypothetical protein LY78DRAFT_664557 [Colletotrichum sublineola]|nr:hypothetical protein LY78DRAFT_664557 [Colletotrichum sublineola]
MPVMNPSSIPLSSLTASAPLTMCTAGYSAAIVPLGGLPVDGCKPSSMPRDEVACWFAKAEQCLAEQEECPLRTCRPPPLSLARLLPSSRAHSEIGGLGAGTWDAGGLPRCVARYREIRGRRGGEMGSR